MRNFNELGKGEQKLILNNILSVYNGITEKQFVMLVDKTNIKGVQFIQISDYKSDKSNGSETASQTINVGASYNNMLIKDKLTYSNVQLDIVDVDKFDYNTIDMNGVSLEDFKAAVTASLPIALAELQAPKKAINTDADIAFNKVLFYNLNTCNLSVKGQSINKIVSVKGDFKIVKSAPKTIAKKLIEKAVNSRTASLRRFNLSNISKSLSISGETLEII